MNRLLEKYQNSVKAELQNKFAYKSSMQIPRLEKIVINMGVGEAVANSKVLDDAVEELTVIAGQKPVVTKAKKSIANFKLREGMPIGCKVTLRGERMYEFLDKLVSIALPRVRDFRGVNPNAFDGPEINFDQVKKSRGMDIVIVTTANTDEEGRTLLSLMGMPFRK